MRVVSNTFLFLAIFLSVAFFSYAREGDKGRGGGGGGGRREAGRGADHAQRAQQRVQQGRGANRAARDNRPNFRSPSLSREGFGRRNENRGQVQRPGGQGNRPAVQPNPQVNRDQLKQRWAQNRKDRRPQQINQQLTDKKIQDFKNNSKGRWDKDRKYSKDTWRYLNKRYPNYRNWFYNNNWRPHYWNDRVNWWRRPYWNNVYSWLGWGAAGAAVAYPIYYDDYGYPVQLNYDVSNYDQSYTDNSVNTTVQQPAAAAPVEGNWLPIGVFAVGSSPQEAAYSTIFMQLALDKQGEIAGTYYNSATNQTFDMDGDVDPKTQLVTWQISNGASPAILETGLYNLTQDVVSVQVTFPGGATQTWALVRIDDSQNIDDQ